MEAPAAQLRSKRPIDLLLVILGWRGGARRRRPVPASNDLQTHLSVVRPLQKVTGRLASAADEFAQSREQNAIVFTAAIHPLGNQPMALPDTREPAFPTAREPAFSAAEIGALAHLYRGEVYRSTVWRTRLDSSTNWAVVTTGIALSATYSSTEASPLPMVLVGLLVSVFLLFEARRYRYFNVWRARARLLETDFYAPMIRGEGVRLDSGWTELLAKDYRDPRYHIGFARAIGRRLRRT